MAQSVISWQRNKWSLLGGKADIGPTVRMSAKADTLPGRVIVPDLERDPVAGERPMRRRLRPRRASRLAPLFIRLKRRCSVAERVEVDVVVAVAEQESAGCAPSSGLIARYR